MKNINRKKAAYILMFVGIALLLIGIVTSVSLGAKDIDLSTIVSSMLHDNNDINTKIINTHIGQKLASIFDFKVLLQKKAQRKRFCLMEMCNCTKMIYLSQKL